MKKTACILIMFFAFVTCLSADNMQKFACMIKGKVTVESFFKAIPASIISIKPEYQRQKPAVLDIPNGYLSLSYEEHEGNSVEYVAALYTAGANNSRTFLMVTRNVHPIAQMQSTEKFWIFEYSSGTCTEQSSTVLPMKKDWSIVKLPRRGTDLVCCELKGGENGIAEECTTFSWSIKSGTFSVKK
jgi:hypothetical protein